MILINGLHPLGIFLTIGLFFILSGVWFQTTMPVQPMKVIGAYAVATGIGADQIAASALMIGVFLLIIGVTGAIDLVGKYTPKPVVRGVQLSTGALLMSQGVRFMIGTSTYQKLSGAAEPYLTIQSLGPVPLGMVIGVLGAVLTFYLLDNKRLPAGLVVIVFGLLLGLILGTGEGFDRLAPGFHAPEFLPLGFPSWEAFTLALLVLVLPQIPMTLGNAVVACADLSHEYFGESASKVTYRGLCISMALANLGAFLVGGMPLCHGAGGLAAHYRFGARTAGSNLMIGGIFVVLALVFGAGTVALVNLLPMSILGVLLLFAGAQLSLTLLDVQFRQDLFVSLLILGVTLASNLAVGFVVGLAAAYALKSKRFQI
jgi:SulP family sulfate permease